MPHPSIRQTAFAVTLTAALVGLPLAEAEAAPRKTAERPARLIELSTRLGGSAWSFVRSLWEKAGISIDENGGRIVQQTPEPDSTRPPSGS